LSNSVQGAGCPHVVHGIVPHVKKLKLPWRRRLALVLAVVMTTVLGLVVTAGVAAAAAPTFASFSAGVFEVGQVKHYWWNNATDDAYAAGLDTAPVDAPNVLCDATVTRTWYVRQPSGEREFHMLIQGGTFNRCRVTVKLAGLPKYRENTTAELGPGQSQTVWWNNAHTDVNVYLVGVLPTVSYDACALEVTTEYRTQPDGENEFVYTVTNVGNVTCSGTLRHVKLPVTDTESVERLTPGQTRSAYAAFYPLIYGVIVTGAVPGTHLAGPCVIRANPVRYYRVGAFTPTFTNTGLRSCSTKATYAVM
jgi:hypothetical protein